MIRRLTHRMRRFLRHAASYALRRLGPSRIARTAQLRGPRRLLHIHPAASLNDYVIVHATRGHVRIGPGTQVNPFTVILGGSGVSIGRDVMIAPHCTFAAGNHDYRQTAVPMRRAGHISKGPIVVEDDVWIAANCTITDGVRLGRGCVVAANSVVTTDVAQMTIVAGAPARVIGRRGGESSDDNPMQQAA